MQSQVPGQKGLKMIFTITSPTNQSLILQTIKETGKILDGLECSTNLKLVEFTNKNLLNLSTVETLILDLAACVDDDKELLIAIENLKIVNDKLQVIIIDSTRYEGDFVLSKCFAMGYFDLIVTRDYVELKAELINSIQNGREYKDSVSFKEHIPLDKIKSEKKIVNDVFIAISGTHSRIGVTHTSIIIANNLRCEGFLVALVEINEHLAFDEIEHSFEVEKKEGYYTLDGIDFYSIEKSTEIEDIKKKGYNFIIIDFGEYQNRNKELFKECDLKLIIAGSKPWEANKTFNVFENTLVDELSIYHFYFNFTASDLREDVKEGMCNLNIHFLDYSEDPFNTKKFPDFDIIFENYIDRESNTGKKRIFNR